MPNLSAPAVLTAGTLASTATTTFDGSTVTVHARSELSGLDLAGLVKIESVVTDLTATTDGATTTLSGGTVVRSEEHTSELQSLMLKSYAVVILKKQMC